jgi:hypothetical protein
MKRIPTKHASVLLLLFACLGPVGADEFERVTPALAEGLVDEISRQVAEIRSLEFEAGVPVEIIDDDRAREYMIGRVHRFQSADRLAATSRAYELLGLLPEGTDILESYLDVLREQAGGFYDPETRSYYLLDDMPAILGPALTAHELTHALEDQHFRLDARIEEVQSDDDRLFARSAVHEGSAMLVMTVFVTREVMAGRLDIQQLQAMGELEEAQSAALADLPQLLMRHLLGPYLLGAMFLHGDELTSVVTEGYPLDRVDRAYRDRPGPLSSEQILHPEKYWEPGQRDDPEVIGFGAAPRALGKGFELQAHGVLGEISLAVLTGGNGTPAPEAGAAEWTDAAAAGWGGDRWELWSRGDGEDVALLVTSWDTEQDAEEFAAAVAEREWWTRRDGRRFAVIAGELQARRAQKVLDRLIRDTTVDKVAGSRSENDESR